MSFVNRLKDFLKFRDISVSQFADTCEIPRPTMSQLLNGRNKKVSDELIRKIHQSYPDVSVLWLMFGEGPMFVSGPVSSPSKTTAAHEAETDQPLNAAESLQKGSISISPNATAELSGPDIASGQSISFDLSSHSGDDRTDININADAKGNSLFDDNAFSDSSNDEGTQDLPKTNISFADKSDKKIVSIIVFYNDNSFESFGPLSGSQS